VKLLQKKIYGKRKERKEKEKEREKEKRKKQVKGGDAK
jgi:hypothetical protein